MTKNSEYANKPGYDEYGYPMGFVLTPSCRIYRLTNTTDEIVISNAPALLVGVVADDKGSNGTVTFRDAATIGGSNVKSVVDADNDHNFHSAEFLSGITAQLSHSNTDVGILWRYK